MNNNDVLRRIRYALKFSDEAVVDIFALVGHVVTPKMARALTGKEEDPEAVFCADEVLGMFLDGVIIHFRGLPKPGSVPPAPEPLTNNEILRKLRIALSMRDDDIQNCMAAGGQKMSKSEVSALFRKRKHRNYREAGNQVLRKFLVGLTMRMR